MYEIGIVWDWLAFAIRWLHVITAIAWIGSSFYFVALDLGLKKSPDLPQGVSGEEWQVHGGGFYNIQKYMVAPARLPEHLIWFKWESYMTWLSGFAMLAVVYYGSADLFLIDRHVLDIPTWQAIVLSMASLSVGWLIYDTLCKSPIGKSTWGLMGLLYLALIAMAWGYTHVFTGRAAFLHLGAFTATIMSANVFFIIMPNQRVVVADLKAGRTPDPKYGKIAKQRSTHNNYLTLPVLFFMLSNHYPLAFATKYNWIIAALVFLMGVTIRHWFNTLHAGKGRPLWTWMVTAILFVIIMWLSTQPKILEFNDTQETSSLPPSVERFVADAHFDGARTVLQTRCTMCHTAEPVYEGIVRPPKNVMFDNDEEIAEYAHKIYVQAGRSHAMPPGNITDMTDKERQVLTAWYESATTKGQVE